MWLSLVRNTEWSVFLDLVSPSFFDVLPPSELRGQAKELISNYVTRPRFLRVREHVSSVVEASGLAVTMRAALPKERGPDGLSEAERRQRGELVLRLFLHQLFRLNTPILDLRSRAIGAEGNRVVWNPAPLYLTWEPDFLPHARNLVVGLFGEDPERLALALEALNLTPAEETLRAHFGRDGGRAVSFKLADFQKCFHQAFVQCRDAGKRLHGNFLPFGLYLACLYEHLETLGQPLDVHAAIEGYVPAEELALHA